MKKHTAVKVDEIPRCDMCGEPASYDCRTIFGSWAFLCKKCFRKYGIGLGLGRGQKLLVRKEKSGNG